MDCKSINGILFQQILKSGFQNLSAHFQDINDLNVFPVPDGDTGTNMRLTFISGLNQIKENESIGYVSSDFSKGMLLGARGNSGVLSSRYFDGLSNAFKGKESVTVEEFKDAMVLAYETAYKAVDVPTEGTILTVAREGIDAIKDTIDYSSICFSSFFSMVVQSMKISLDNTPNLLPVLKDAGVVDSGGKGLLTIFEGFMKFFVADGIVDEVPFTEEKSSLLPSYDFSLFTQDSVLEYGYCTEFLLQLQTSKIDISKFDLSSFIEFLHEHGDSIVCFQNGSIVKVHIHTKKPYEIIEFAQRYGEFLTFKMENMTLQNKNVKEKKNEKRLLKKKYAIVSIAQGEGIIDLFKSLGSDIVLDGGHTMNTSSAELIDAFKEANAEEIILLPNEKNILMAAHQAAELYKESKIHVLETKSIPAGYACLSMIMGEEETAEECYSSMKEENDWVTTGFICRCVRDTLVDGVSCVKGDYIEGVNSSLVGCDDTLSSALEDLLSHVKEIEEKETLFFFYGKDVSLEEANSLKTWIEKKYPHLEVGMYEGKQNVYDILLGIN